MDMDQVERKSRTQRSKLPLIVAALTALVLLVSPQLGAKDKDVAEGLQVGTYQPQKVFEQSPGRAKLMQAVQSAQKSMQEIQKSGDRQKAQKVQQDFQKKQQQIIQKFEKTVQKALPDVAEETGVQIIAARVEYVAEGITTTDLTPEIVKAIGGTPKAKTPASLKPKKK
jgi:hypothetical protein